MRLLTVAHGTRSRADNTVAAAITQAAGARLGMAAEVSYVELCAPLFSDRIASDEPTVVVPLLLSTGFHMRVDVPDAVAAARGPVWLRGTLGPDPLLASAMVDRLRQSGAVSGQPVTMIAAGSRDATATADLTRARTLLAEAWGADVRLATLAGLGERPADVVRPGDAVVPYLLAPGHFSRLATAQAREAGATVVADVLGAHTDVVDLVVARALATDLSSAGRWGCRYRDSTPPGRRPRPRGRRPAALAPADR